MGVLHYIYFEIKQIRGAQQTEPEIQHENILLLKPHTNSKGIWGFTNITERKGFSEPSYCIVTQYWVDLEKFKDNDEFQENILVKNALEKIRKTWKNQNMNISLNY